MEAFQYSLDRTLHAHTAFDAAVFDATETAVDNLGRTADMVAKFWSIVRSQNRQFESTVRASLPFSFFAKNSGTDEGWTDALGFVAHATDRCIGLMEATAASCASECVRPGQPAWNIDQTVIEGEKVRVTPTTVWNSPYYRLTYMDCGEEADQIKYRPILLIDSADAGHWATLHRPTVRAALPFFRVFVSEHKNASKIPLILDRYRVLRDWRNPERVPFEAGRCNLHDLTEYKNAMLDRLIEICDGDPVNILAICSAGTTLVRALAWRGARENGLKGLGALVGMAWPGDTRTNPTQATKDLQRFGVDWARTALIKQASQNAEGAGRFIGRGKTQLDAFMTPNIFDHLMRRIGYFNNIVREKRSQVDKQDEFDREFRAVKDLAGEGLLHTIHDVFIHQLLPRGLAKQYDETLNVANITIPTIAFEASEDDVSPVGQTIDLAKLFGGKIYYRLQQKVGHLGIFSGSVFEQEVLPLMRDLLYHLQGLTPLTHSAADLEKYRFTSQSAQQSHSRPIAVRQSRVARVEAAA